MHYVVWIFASVPSQLKSPSSVCSCFHVNGTMVQLYLKTDSCNLWTWCVQDEETQVSGLVVIENYSGFGLVHARNFDQRSAKLFTAVVQVLSLILLLIDWLIDWSIDQSINLLIMHVSNVHVCHRKVTMKQTVHVNEKKKKNPHENWKRISET